MRQSASLLDFSGGMNDNLWTFRLQPNEVRLLQNMRLLDSGEPIMRGGFALDISQPGSSSGPYFAVSYVDSGGLVRHGFFGSTTFHYYTGSWNSVASVSGSAVTSAVLFRDGSQAVFYVADAGLLNKLPLSTYTPSTDIAGSPSVDWLAVHGNRLWGILTSASNSPRLYYSSLANGDDLGQASATAGFIDLHDFTGGGGGLTGLLSAGEILWIFSTSGIWYLTGSSPEDFAINVGTKGLSQVQGLPATTSLSQGARGVTLGADQTLYYITDPHDGKPFRFMRLRPTGEVTDISSARLTNTIKALCTDAATTYRWVLHNEEDSEIWFVVSNSASPEVMFVYNYKLDAWYLYTTVGIFFRHGVVTPDGDVRVMSSSPVLHDRDNYTDTNNAIRTRLITRPFPLKPVTHWHSARRLSVVAHAPANSSVSVKIRTHDNTYTVGTLTTGSVPEFHTFTGKGKSRLLELEFLQTDVTTANPWSLGFIELEAATAGPQRQDTDMVQTVSITN